MKRSSALPNDSLGGRPLEFRTCCRADWLIDRCGRSVYQSADAIDKICCGYDSAMHERAFYYERDSMVFRRIEATPGRYIDRDGDSYTAPFAFDQDDGDSLRSESEVTYQISLATMPDSFDQQSLTTYQSRTRTFDTLSDASFLTAPPQGGPVILGLAKKNDNESNILLPCAKERVEETKDASSILADTLKAFQRFEASEGDTPTKELKAPFRKNEKFAAVLQEEGSEEEDGTDASSFTIDLTPIYLSDQLKNRIACGRVAAETKEDDDNIKASVEFIQQVVRPTAVAMCQRINNSATKLLTQADEQASKQVSALVSQAEVTSARNLAVLVHETDKDLFEPTERLMSDTEQSVSEIADKAIEFTLSTASSFTVPTICTLPTGSGIKQVAHDDPVEVAQFEVSCVTHTVNKPHVFFKHMNHVTRPQTRLIEI